MALPALVEALNDPTKFVRRAVIQALGEIGSAEATPWLLRALHQDDYFIRWAAAEALGKIGASEAVDDLAAFLEDNYEPPLQDKPERRFSDVVALALEQIGTSEAQLALANRRTPH
jgi:HEAT repeat protein